MPLKKSTGNMYTWTTHTFSALGGECPHRCRYCYVDNPRFGRPERYRGELRVIAADLAAKLGEGRIIFMENCNDLFAEAVPQGLIDILLAHAARYPGNTYVYQTKNPARAIANAAKFPPKSILGCTIETNRTDVAGKLSEAPAPSARYLAMRDYPGRKFITIEPILDCAPEILARWIAEIHPEFVNVGADSKGHGLPEPSAATVRRLLELLGKTGVEIREKHNLGRILDVSKI